MGRCIQAKKRTTLEYTVSRRKEIWGWVGAYERRSERPSSTEWNSE